MSVLKQWSMCCPSCKDDSQLDIAATVEVRLTPGGSSAEDAFCGDTQWDEKSHVICRNCLWEGRVENTEAAGRKRLDLIASDKILVTMSEVVTYRFEMPITAEHKDAPAELEDFARAFFAGPRQDMMWRESRSEGRVLSLEPVK